MLIHGRRFLEGQFRPEDSRVCREHYEQRAEEFPEDPDQILDSATWYVMANITMTSAEEKGISPDTPLEAASKKIQEGWVSLQNYEGVSGTASIDSDGEAVNEVYMMKGGKAEFTRVG